LLENSPDMFVIGNGKRRQSVRTKGAHMLNLASRWRAAQAT
jgi:hypothetical protein